MLIQPNDQKYLTQSRSGGTGRTQYTERSALYSELWIFSDQLGKQKAGLIKRSAGVCTSAPHRALQYRLLKLLPHSAASTQSNLSEAYSQEHLSYQYNNGNNKSFL